MTADQISEQLLLGDRRALARAITLAENGESIGKEIIASVYPSTGSAHYVGITGPPGVGKSSLTSALLTLLRQSDPGRLGVISVDPSSPFTQGALLGDRIRLSDHFLDKSIFIRSMGTRGHLGGLSEATLQTAILLDAWGASNIFVETVGVGQSEIEIARMADTIILVLMPGSGDAVQALKAGVMEIPDIIVINKADHVLAKSLRAQIRSVLTLEQRDWVPPIIDTEAIHNRGIDRLWEAVLEHRAYMRESEQYQQRRNANLEHEVFTLASARALRLLQDTVSNDPALGQIIRDMHNKQLDPITCVERLFLEVFGNQV